MAAVYNKSILGGGDVASFSPRNMAQVWARTAGGPVRTGVPTLPRLVNDVDPRGYARPTQTPRPLPQIPAAKGSLPGHSFFRAGGTLASNNGPANPYSTALSNVRAGGTGVSTMTKSPAQNAFTQALQQQHSAAAPGKKTTLTQYVRDVYAGQSDAKKALDQESKALDRVFSNSGLVDELANSRAKRRAGVLATTKMAMDRAKRQNNVSRMMSGNSSYLDRAYGDVLAKIAADAAIQDADLEAGDIRYVQGERMGALGGRDRLINNYLQMGRLPYQFQQEMFRDDLYAGQGLAALENQNSIYETPEQRLMREIRQAEGLDHLQQRNRNYIPA